MSDKAKNTKSKVQLLPEPIKTELNTLIRSGAMSQKDILEQINQLIEAAGLPDEDKLSRSGLNRYTVRWSRTGRGSAGPRSGEVWTSKLGQAPASDLGKMLQEFVRTMAFETSMKLMDDPDKVVDPKSLGQLALVIQRIEAAAMSSHKVEKEIRASALAEAAEAAEKITSKAGLSAETAAAIKREILGIT
jgi:hypothetical protein